MISKEDLAEIEKFLAAYHRYIQLSFVVGPSELFEMIKKMRPLIASLREARTANRELRDALRWHISALAHVRDCKECAEDHARCEKILAKYSDEVDGK